MKGDCEGGGFSVEKFRNLNRRGLWPLVSVEKDSHSRHWRLWLSFPLLALPPEEIYGRETLGERPLL